jgi:hypothetical protein
MVNLVHNEYSIKIFSDELYSLKSTDNVHNYNFKYGDFTDINNDNFFYAPKYGVIIKDNMGFEKSAVLFPDSGTGGSPYEKSALIDNDNLLITAGDCIQTIDEKLRAEMENAYVNDNECNLFEGFTESI